LLRVLRPAARDSTLCALNITLHLNKTGLTNTVMIQVSDTGNILMLASFPSSFNMQKAFGVKICASSIRKARNRRNRSTRWGRRFRLYDEASAAVSPIVADALHERLRLVAALGLCRSWANYRPCTTSGTSGKCVLITYDSMPFDKSSSM